MKPSLPLAPNLGRTTPIRASAPIPRQAWSRNLLRRSLLVAIACIALPPLLLSQQSPPALESAPSAALPTAPAPTLAPSNPFAAPSTLFPPLNVGTAASHQNQLEFSFTAINSHSRQRGRSSADPFDTGMNTFQPASNFGSHSGSLSSSTGFYAVDTSRFGASPAALPSLNQIMRGSFYLPFSSSPALPSSSFRFTYRDTLLPGGTFADLGRPNAAAIFTTSDLGNGVFLSAGTGYGIRSTAGAPAASLGNEGGPKHSGTAVNLKLSF